MFFFFCVFFSLAHVIPSQICMHIYRKKISHSFFFLSFFYKEMSGGGEKRKKTQVLVARACSFGSCGVLCRIPGEYWRWTLESVRWAACLPNFLLLCHYLMGLSEPLPSSQFNKSYTRTICWLKSNRWSTSHLQDKYPVVSTMAREKAKVRDS